MVEYQIPNLKTRVQFSSLAPHILYGKIFWKEVYMMATPQFEYEILEDLKDALTYLHDYCMSLDSCRECMLRDSDDYFCPLHTPPMDWDVDGIL